MYCLNAENIGDILNIPTPGAPSHTPMVLYMASLLRIVRSHLWRHWGVKQPRGCWTSAPSLQLPGISLKSYAPNVAVQDAPCLQGPGLRVGVLGIRELPVCVPAGTNRKASDGAGGARAGTGGWLPWMKSLLCTECRKLGTRNQGLKLNFLILEFSLPSRSLNQQSSAKCNIFK